MNIQVDEQLKELIKKVETEMTNDDPRFRFVWFYSENGMGVVGYAGAFGFSQEYDISISDNGYITAYTRGLSKFAFDTFKKMEYDSDYEVV